jgi:hypothetical protein
MQKIKILLNAVAVIVAVGGALITYSYTGKENQPQYIPYNNSYQPAGEFGVDYRCYESDSVCTYYQPDSVNNATFLLPCRKGQYVPVSK